MTIKFKRKNKDFFQQMMNLRPTPSTQRAEKQSDNLSRLLLGGCHLLAKVCAIYGRTSGNRGGWSQAVCKLCSTMSLLRDSLMILDHASPVLIRHRALTHVLIAKQNEMRKWMPQLVGNSCTDGHLQHDATCICSSHKAHRRDSRALARRG